MAWLLNIQLLGCNSQAMKTFFSAGKKQMADMKQICGVTSKNDELK